MICMLISNIQHSFHFQQKQSMLAKAGKGSNTK